jgi:type I restriction enzyme S subunit
MVDSELGEIPKGWGVGSIYDISTVIYGAPFKSSLFNQDKKGYPLIRIRDLKTYKPQNWTEEVHSKGTKVQPGDLVVGMDAEFRPHFWLGEVGWLNQRVCLFKPKIEFSRLFVREIIRPHLEFFENSSVGTTVIHLGKGDIDTFKSIIPSSCLSKLFTELSEPFIIKVIENSIENESLRNLRDTLLPKLISGELEVSQIKNLP